MQNKPQQFKAADWRGVIQLNQIKTIAVLVVFIIIYAFVGLLLDSYHFLHMYRDATLGQVWGGIFTGQLFPFYTLITCAIAVIAILVSFKFHDRLMLLGTEARQIDQQNPANQQEQELVNIVEELKIAAGMRYAPRIFIIEADYMNAFASGFSEKSAMVAITSGLLQKLNRDELQAVMAHELSHIRHGDIKLTLMASVLANIMLIIVDILFYSALFSSNNNNSESRNGGGLLIIILLLRYLLPVLTMFLLLFLSRKREYMADAGSVELTRNPKAMATALLKIRDSYQQSTVRPVAHEGIRNQAYIFDAVSAGFMKSGSPAEMLSTHPSIKNRLLALGFKIEDDEVEKE